MTALSRSPRGEIRWYFLVRLLNVETTEYAAATEVLGKSRDTKINVSNGTYKISLDLRWEVPPYKFLEWHIPFPPDFRSSAAIPILYVKWPKNPGESLSFGLVFENRKLSGVSGRPEMPVGGAARGPLFTCKMEDLGDPYELKIEVVSSHEEEALFTLKYWLNVTPSDPKNCISHFLKEPPHLVPS